MARRFATDIDLLKFSLLNAMLHPVSADPSGLGAGDEGRVWHNTTTHKFMYWNGTAAIDMLARANHSGTQLASTISDLAATVQAYRLDQFVAPNTDLSLGSHKLTNVTDPSANQDAATKNYVDTQISGLASGQILKGSVKAAVTTNVSLSTPGATLDGVSMSNGDLVLLTGQTTASANGPYVFNGAASALTRATNWDTTGEAVRGSFWVVEQGSKGDSYAILTNDTAITLGTTALTFTFISNATTYSAGNGLTLSSNTFSVVADTGILVSGSGVAVDTTKVVRKVTGVVPTSTSGIFTVAGAVVTVNHALGNYAPRLTVRAHTSPASGYSQGQLVEVDEVATDQNNLQVTLPAAPAANNWFISVSG